MTFFTSKTKTATVITVTLLMASVVLMAISVQAQEDQPHGLIGNVGPALEYNVVGYPHLGDLPSGVTPAYSLKTYAYLSIAPNPIGVGQTLLVNVWTSPGMMNEFYRQGYKVTIQKPDGTEDVVGPFNSYLADATGWFNYICDQVGTWKFKFDAPGTYIPVGDYMARPGFPNAYPDFHLGASEYWEPCSTDWQNLTVQADMVASWRSLPLPTDYWNRPVSAENREWYSISGNYPWTGAYYYPGGRIRYASNYQYTAYAPAPNTAHVAWRRQGNIGGLIGGDTYYSTRNVGGGTPSIVYAGRCYQTITKLFDNRVQSVWECYDLRTGQVYWDFAGVPAPTIIIYEPPGVSQTFAEFSGTYSVYLAAISGGRLLKYDPWTGQCSQNISLPSYISSNTIYNNDLVLTLQTISYGNYRLINWSMAGSSTNFTSRIRSNITYPFVMSSTIISADGNQTVPITPTVGNAIDYDAGIAYQVGWGMQAPMGYTAYNDRGVSGHTVGYNVTAVNLYTGAVLFNKAAANDTYDTIMSSSTAVADRGKVAVGMAQLHWTAWDSSTGQIAWHSDDTGYPWGNWWAYNTASYDFNESKGAIIATGYNGVYAIDWDNGHIIWQFQASATPFETPYDEQPFFTGVKIADGKIYAYSGEHTPTQPSARGMHLYCINATNGKLLWQMTGNMAPGAVADGYLTASNSYDGYMYVFGKGKSATTVLAPDVAVSLGTAVTIKGTVMDMSPGDQGSTTNPTARLDSPTKAGTVPCVSKDSISTQMEYLYMQHPIDGLYHNETISGVPVILTAIDSNNKVYDIGTTTTNGYYGTFNMAWTPPAEGTYTITADFAGDDSYGRSSGATGLTVGPAQTTPSTPEIPTPVDYTPWFYGVMAAIIIAIIIGIIAILVALRKR